MKYPHRVLAAHGAAFGIVLSSLFLASCGGSARGNAPDEGPPPTEVTAVTVNPKTVAIPYQFNGRLEGSREVEIRARVSGILLERTYSEGRAVKKGQTLFRIDPAPYKAEVQAATADLEVAKAGLARAEREVKRLEPLLAERAASRRDYDNALSDVEQARASLLAAQARLDQAELNLSYTRVEAPISGFTSRSEHSEGSLVTPGENGLLTRISQVEPIWVRFSASDQTLMDMRKAIATKQVVSPETYELEVELELADGTVYPERGKVNFSDSFIDPATGSVELRAELPNRAGDLIPGQFVRVRLVGPQKPDAMLIPQRAVQQGQEGKFVFVVDAANKAVVKPIQVGQWLGTDWIVESGLNPGDRVIVDGVIRVQPNAPVRVVNTSAASTGETTQPGRAK